MKAHQGKTQRPNKPERKGPKKPTPPLDLELEDLARVLADHFSLEQETAPCSK